MNNWMEFPIVVEQPRLERMRGASSGQKPAGLRGQVC